MDDLYHEEILEHYKHPRNQGKIKHVPEGVRLLRLEARNQGCGDAFTAELLIQDGNVINFQWEGVGCAISTASMSQVSEWVKGKALTQLKDLDKTILLANFGLSEISFAREHCLCLPLQLFAGKF